MRRIGWLPALAGSMLVLAPVAVASPTPRDGTCEAAQPLRQAARRRRSRSVGLPWRGRLEHGVRLRESSRVRFVTEYTERRSHFGTWQLVQLIERAAERVERRLPGVRLSVGEISARRGGHIDGHRSHQSGRDVDIGFYMTDAQGRPHDAYAYAAFGGDGVGRGPNRMLRFDDARNWELVGKLVADGDARVQHIFVSNPIERRLLREGRRRGAPSVVLERAARVMSQPGHHPHRNHFHVRIYCNPRERPGCQDRGPFHDWYPGRSPGGD